jgi:hypothetical protein
MTFTNPSRALSKSKLVAFRQCPKRLWLEVHRPEARDDSRATQAIFRAGHEVGTAAQRIYDPTGKGTVIDLQVDGVVAAIDRTNLLLKAPRPLFEAGFSAEGALAFADVMLPVRDGETFYWRMVEVKSSTSVKSYQEDDVAIQSFVAKASGVDLRSVSIAHIDSTWVYQGDGDYNGLLIEKDMTESAFARSADVKEWIADAQSVAAQAHPPDSKVGPQCEKPFPCGFRKYCGQSLAAVQFPVEWLPRIQAKALKEFLSEKSVCDMREVPEALLTPKQRLVRKITVSGKVYFDAEGAQRDLRTYSLPVYFLDFETIQFGLPRWAGTRPFQMLPFQFSLHRMDERGLLSHHGFLDISGRDPSEAFAAALVSACADPHPVFVYNSGFEGSRLRELAQRFPLWAPALLNLRSRLVDLLPIAESRYYHPSQQGSWSIKKVLPTMGSAWSYDALSGVQDGSMAMEAYLEAIDPAVAPERKAVIQSELVRYCMLDTLAMVEVWRKFSQKC